MYPKGLFTVSIKFYLGKYQIKHSWKYTSLRLLFHLKILFKFDNEVGTSNLWKVLHVLWFNPIKTRDGEDFLILLFPNKLLIITYMWLYATAWYFTTCLKILEKNVLLRLSTLLTQIIFSTDGQSKSFYSKFCPHFTTNLHLLISIFGRVFC